MKQADQFLGELFKDKHELAAVQIWVRSDKPLTYIKSDLSQAAQIAVENGEQHDVYVACGLAPRHVERAQRTRLKAAEVCGIPGVWADLDVNGGPDSKEGAAPTVDAALELASSLLKPSIIVNSGYGVQAWWLWEDGPWMFPERKDQDAAKRIVAGFQGALRAAARRAGWGLDATQDLSRVMRIPGTFNHKGEKPVPVKALSMDGCRYNIEEIGELGQGFYKAEEDRTNGLDSGDAIAIDIRHGVGIDPRVAELLNSEPEFKALWEVRKSARSGRSSWTPSEFEMAICNWLVRAGLDAQAIADVLVLWRNTIEPGDPRKKLRPSRLAATIGKVMRTVEVENIVSEAERAQDAASDTLAHISHGVEPPNEAKALAAFNQLIRGPALARLKQYSRDPERARFIVELEDGSEVALGPFQALASQSEFRKAYAVATGHYPMAVKVGKWDTAVGGLMKIAVVVDDQEDSRVGTMRAWLAEYVEAAGSTDRDGACASQGPFSEEEEVYLSLAHFVRWLRRVMGERTDHADIASVLRLMGFVRIVVNYRKPDGARSTRSYFRGPSGTAGEMTETPYAGK